ncbi:MAG: hypothetical protein A2X54_00950 [Nitrospirae bacterium GWF2_44_13]|nr:MAG: hypothetical protein A2X54_00950 [Nitrospirae bacterium GWF2_44_13]OGW31252.1 MAG: hypothetical protein A2088_01520 [Nitrospirae bacterium GWD2_44_7]OGW74410.1 MAG: hypothetical protein A2484_05420 [Nitrospirae bacterium RIFOXYC2_FULL_44_7]HBG92236.1 hypothetical protein [Nitrospiraceae bacterium]HBU05709.1 hypothetical protein [Nitrospiraceae bacterium]
MTFRCRWFFLPLLICFLIITESFAVTPQIPEMPDNYVVDLAGIVDNNIEQNLNGYLKELEQKTTAQVVVLTITSLEGESLEEFSIKTAHQKWKLGQKGKDNGALIVVSIQDRKYRFEIGYGLEGVLPDSLTGSIGREYMAPNFKKGDYSKGIYAAALALTGQIASSHGIEVTGMPKIKRSIYAAGRKKDGGKISKFLTILLLIGAVILFIKNPRLLIFLLLASSMGGGRREGWGGGGGFGGGGSFGGGGGGGFGGGGSSGGW